MKRIFTFTTFACCLAAASSLGAYTPPAFPYAPAAGEAASTALWHEDESLAGWAISVVEVSYGEEVAEEWRNPENATGPADASGANVLVLGRGGQVVLSFEPALADGDGDDFAVFENSFTDTFLELAFVEVSTDGVHFVRFPSYSQTLEPVPGFGTVQPEFVHGFAGKYRAGYGTPFDLNELARAHAAVASGYTGFSSAYADHLLETFPFLNVEQVNFVRLVDIPGNGTFFDSEGFAIYDPYPTIITAGFDLDAVGVLNRADPDPVAFSDWSSWYGLPPDAGADTDRDGWPQYLEYLYGSHPNASSSVPSQSLSLGPDGQLLLTWWINLSAGDEPEMQLSEDGVNWSPVTDAGVVKRLGTRAQNGIVLALEQVSIEPASQVLLLRSLAQP